MTRTGQKFNEVLKNEYYFFDTDFIPNSDPVNNKYIKCTLI